MSDIAAIREAFEAIYRDDRWSNGSGPGSHPDNTIEYRAYLSRFIEANAIRSVTDLGCGDWQFSHLLDWSRVVYLGLDVVPAVIDRNARRYNAPGIEFRLFQSLDDLPGGDLLVAKEVLQHLPNDTIAEYLGVIARRYRYALLTDAIEPAAQVNADIAFGGWRPVRLDRPPFDAHGAAVFMYFPQSGSHFWKNQMFLLFGDWRPRTGD